MSKKLTNYQRLYARAVKFMPSLISAGREAGMQDSVIIGLFKAMGTYFTTLGEMKNLDELPKVLNRKRVKELDALIIKGFDELAGPLIKAVSPYVLTAKFMAANGTSIGKSFLDEFPGALKEVQAMMELYHSFDDEDEPVEPDHHEPVKEPSTPPRQAKVISFEEALANNRLEEYLANAQ